MASPQEPVALWTTKAEREKYESFADLYAIIKTVEKLEKASSARLPVFPPLTSSPGVRARRGAAGGVRDGVPGPHRQVPHAAHGAAR